MRWLHLSDLHLSADKRWLWHWLKDLLFDDLRALHPKAGPWDLVFFTGDLSKTGSADELKAVDQVLADLWALFEELQPGQRPQLLAVPGNHDLVRPDELATSNSDYLTGLPVESMLERADPTDGTTARCREAFATYQAWWDRCSLKPEALRPGLFPGDFTASIDVRGGRLGVVGLNTAILQLTAGDYEGKLWAHPRQFYAACPDDDGPGWASQHDACLLLTHHPPAWLAPDALDLFNGCITNHGRFALHLFGHMHSVEARIGSVNGLPFKGTWQASSLLGEEPFEVGGKRVDRPSYGYAAGELECDEGRVFVRFWPRVAHALGAQAGRLGSGEWRFGPANDRILLRDEVSDDFQVGRCHRQVSRRRVNDEAKVAVADQAGDDWFEVAVGDEKHPGFLPWEQRLATLAQGQNPYVVGRSLPANSPVFVGRQNLLRDITEALTSHECPPSLSLLGERRMGKSSFLNQLFEALKATSGLVVMKGTAQAWANPTPTLFFAQLGRALARALRLQVPSQSSYDDLKRLLRGQAERMRFVLLLDELEELVHNPQFLRDFYANLRALGDGPGYRLGYLICSRLSLPDLCEASHEIMASAFWNIFSTPTILGPLAPAEADALMSEPWRRTSACGAPDLARIQRATGRHPAFLQIALDQAWKATPAGAVLDEVDLASSLRDHFRSLWRHRTTHEQAYLRGLLRGEVAPLGEHGIRDLRDRGILTGDGGIFSPAFAGFLAEMAAGQ